MLPRAHLLRAIDAAAAVGDLSALRSRVVAAAEPDVFMAEGGGDFF